MPQHILCVQGGGEGSYAENQALVDYLTQSLGEQFVVHYPKFKGLESIDYSAWQSQAIETLDALEDGVIIVAHSLGGPALLKVMSEHQPACQIRALYLIAMPYKCADGEWGSDEFALTSDFAERLPPIEHMVLYHSRDDEWVPFEHLEHYAEKLPGANTVPLDGRGHSCMKMVFSELVEDIVRYGNPLS